MLVRHNHCHVLPLILTMRFAGAGSQALAGVVDAAVEFPDVAAVDPAPDDWTMMLLPNGPTGFIHWTTQAFDAVPMVPVQVTPAGICATRGCDNVSLVAAEGCLWQEILDTNEVGIGNISSTSCAWYLCRDGHGHKASI